MVKSLASVKDDYVMVQGVVQDDCLHIQGLGPSINRPYGVAVTLTAPMSFLNWFRGLARPEHSATGSSNRYTPFQVALRGKSVHGQVAGPGFNRSYGAAFDTENEDLYSFLEVCVLEAEEEEETEITLS